VSSAIAARSAATSIRCRASLDRGPGRAGRAEAGARADFRGGFLPCSYGFRPKRRAQDAIAEIHHYSTSPDAWGQFLALASVSTSASGTWTMSAGVVR